MWPAVGSIRRRMARPTVDLPQPDSPTRPSVSPSPIAKLTPSTANTRSGLTRNPRLIGKCFFSASTTSTGSPACGAPACALTLASVMAGSVRRSGMPTRGPVAGTFFLVSRSFVAAAIVGARAARRKGAARRQAVQRGHDAWDLLQPTGGGRFAAQQPKPRQRRQQSAGILMLRLREQRADLRLFHLA